jgi:outer membrane protein assembly factor BamB
MHSAWLIRLSMKHRRSPLIPIAAQPGGGGGGRGASGRGGGGGGGGPRPTGVPAANRVYVIASDGSLRTLNVQTGTEVDPPVKFLSPGAKASGIIAIDGTVFAATADGCGGNANGIHAIDLASKNASSWKTSGGSVAGIAGAAFSLDGTLFAATTDGEVVALDSKTLQMKDSFSAGKSAFNSSPSVFSSGGKSVVAVSNSDGKIYLLDGASLKTALATSTKYVNPAPNTTAGVISTFKDADGTVWLFAAAVGTLAADTKFPLNNGTVTDGAIVAFKVVDQAGKPSLQPAWVSRDMATPLAPAISNGVVFALASGAQSSKPAVLYALDAKSGKDLWNSGTTITTHASANAGLAVSASQLYFGTVDGTLWTFGYYMEH